MPTRRPPAPYHVTMKVNAAKPAPIIPFETGSPRDAPTAASRTYHTKQRRGSIPRIVRELFLYMAMHLCLLVAADLGSQEQQHHFRETDNEICSYQYLFQRAEKTKCNI